MLETLFPPVPVIILSSIFSVAKFENQRWLRAMDRGMIPGSETVVAVANITAIVSMIFGLAFFVSFGLQHGWMACIGLILVSLGAPIAYGLFARFDRPLIWIFATVCIWPVMIALAFKTTWFGLFG